jgi:hypothetical protein
MEILRTSLQDIEKKSNETVSILEQEKLGSESEKKRIQKSTEEQESQQEALRASLQDAGQESNERVNTLEQEKQEWEAEKRRLQTSLEEQENQLELFKASEEDDPLSLASSSLYQGITDEDLVRINHNLRKDNRSQRENLKNIERLLEELSTHSKKNEFSLNLEIKVQKASLNGLFEDLQKSRIQIRKLEQGLPQGSPRRALDPVDQAELVRTAMAESVRRQSDSQPRSGSVGRFSLRGFRYAVSSSTVSEEDDK